MATEPRQIPVTPSPDAARRRLNIHGIKEMPAGYDAEVAELFRDLRAASNLSETDLAVRLGTRMEVVQALEQGALFALPPWPETCRVVNGYGALLHLDVRPLLRRIYAQLEAGIVVLRPKHMPEVPTMTPPEPMDLAHGANHRGAPQSQPRPQAPRPAPQQAYPPQPQTQWPGTTPPPYPATPQPQPPYPQAPQQHPQANRHPQPRPVQARPPQPQPHPHPQPQQSPQQPPAPQPQPASVLDAEFPDAPAPTADKPKRKSALLKWGLVALVISLIAFGLWMVLGNLIETGTQSSTSANGPAPVLDPDDPRSRKADRLPGQF